MDKRVEIHGTSRADINGKRGVAIESAHRVEIGVHEGGDLRDGMGCMDVGVSAN